MLGIKNVIREKIENCIHVFLLEYIPIIDNNIPDMPIAPGNKSTGNMLIIYEAITLSLVNLIRYNAYKLANK